MEESPSKTPPIGPFGNDALDIKLVSDIIMQLNIVRKNSALYPKGHPQLDSSLSRLMGFLSQHFNYSRDLSLAVARDSLILGGLELPRNNPIFQEYAAFLHAKSIYHFAIMPGITPEEAHNFHLLLSGEKNLALPGESLTESLARLGIAHIELKLLDMSRFTFAEVTEIDLEQQLAAEGRSGSSWQTYIKTLLEKGTEEAFTTDEGGIELSNVDPVKLAKFVNSLESKQDKTVSYDKAVAKYVRELTSGDLSMDRVKDTQVKDSFLGLVSVLNADMRAMLLSRDFEFSARAKSVTPAILDKPRAKLLLGVLEEINRLGMKIDRKVYSLVDQLAGLDTSEPEKQADQEPELGEEDANAFSQMVTSFLTTTSFRPMSYPEDRKRWAGILEESVKRMVQPENPSSLNPKTLLAECKPAEVLQHFGMVLADLLDLEADPATVEAAARNLSDLLYEHAEKGRWEEVLDLWRELATREKALADKDMARSELCRKARLQAWQPENVGLICSAILEQGLKKNPELSEILVELGSESPGLLVNALAEQPDGMVKNALEESILSIREKAMPLVLARLSDENSAVVRAMLDLLQKARDKYVLPKVEKLLEHPELPVRAAALKTMTVLGHVLAPNHIIAFINDMDEETSIEGIRVASLVFDKSVTAALVDVVTDSRLFSSDFGFRKKREAVKSLSFIGSEIALPELYKVVSSKKLFSAKDFEKLKLEIFRSLDGYSLDKIGAFLELGKTLKDMEIANICIALQKKRAKAES
ncbi:MAG: hypothetical protein AB1921_04445 [Thermodesulfobacteriota bacterium]